MAEETAIFAGGCFWCMVHPFDQLPGIQKVVSGYTGGTKPNPTYEEVCSGATGHTEAVEITFDPEVFPYEKLLDIYWRQIDPTDAGGQFYDRGLLPAGYFLSKRSPAAGGGSFKKRLEESGRFKKPIAVTIEPASAFYPAESYHQDYYRKNPTHYEAYRQGSGRAAFIRNHWRDEHEG